MCCRRTAKSIRVPTTTCLWKGKGTMEQKAKFATYLQMWKCDNCDEETARENKAMRKRHALNQDRCHQPDENSFNTGSFFISNLKGSYLKNILRIIENN